MPGLVEVMIANTAVATALGACAWWVDGRGRHPSIAHALYLLALLKLVTPPLWTVPAFTWPADPVAVESTELASPASPPIEAAAAPRATTPDTPSPAGVPWERAWLFVWVAGSAIVLLTMVRRAASFRAAVRSTGPAPDAWEREARELLPVVGLWAGHADERVSRPHQRAERTDPLHIVRVPC